MIFSDLSFFFRESIIGIRRSSLMTFISIATVTISLIIFGFFLILTVNLNNLADIITSKLEIRLFLKDNLTKNEIKSFQRKLKYNKAIKKVEFIDKKTAWEKFKNNFQNLNLENVENNPLPHSFRIQVFQKRSIVPTAKYLKSYNYYVEDINYGGEIAERMEKFSNFAKTGGLILVFLLGFAALLIIVNTIRLTILARQEEITIMRLVGATDRFIKTPFIIEGCIIGILGALISIVFLSISYQLGGLKIQESIPFLPLVFQNKQLLKIYITVGISGAFIGILGAYISVSKMLKNQV